MKSVWHSEPSCVWPQAPPSGVIFPPHPFTPRHARRRTQRLQHLRHTSCWPGLNTFTPAPLQLSLDTSNPHCPMHITSQAWKSNWETQRSWEPRLMMALPHFTIFHHIPDFHSRIFYFMSPQPVKSCQFICCCSSFFNSGLPSALPPDSHICNQVVTVSRKVWRFTGVTASLYFPTVCSRIFGQLWWFCCILLCFISGLFKTLRRLCFKK